MTSSQAGVAALAAPYAPLLRKIRRERRRMLSLLQGPLAKFFDAFPSQANFLMVKARAHGAAPQFCRWRG